MSFLFFDYSLISSRLHVLERSITGDINPSYSEGPTFEFQPEDKLS